TLIKCRIMFTLTELLPSRDAFRFIGYGHAVVGWRLATKNPVILVLYNVYWVLFTALGIYLPIALMISYVNEFSNFTPGELITSAQWFFDIPNALVKALTLYLSLWRIDKAKELLDQLDKSCIREEEKVQVHRYVLRCNYFYTIYIVIYICYPLTTFSAAVIFNGVSAWNVFNPLVNWRDGTWELWLASCIEFAEVLVIVFYHHATDIYPVIYSTTIRLHMDLLRQRVQRLRSDDTKSEAETYADLVGCIKDHKLILDYCNILRPLLSRTVFCQFLVVGVILGLCFTNIFFFSDFWSGGATVVYIVGCTSQTFPFCYICNMLGEDVDQLTLTIFQSNWQGASRRYKSSLIYFLHKAQQPIRFTAGSIFEINLGTNISLAKFAFSVVTIVQQFNLAEKLDHN
ncbi:hypothetical protein KR044_003843, partial [Drosophila immigrans]